MRFTSLLPLVLLVGSSVSAQFPPVGMIDFYGLRKIRVSAVRSALSIKPGDDALETLKNKDAYIRKLRAISNVADATIDLVCCDDFKQNSMIFVGVRERGSVVMEFRKPPTGSVRLPAEIVQAGNEFQEAFLKWIAEKNFSEDDSAGHALFGNADARKIQLRFVKLADPNLPILRRVIRESSDPRQRALAAQVIAYASDKKSIVPDLAFAMNDSDGGTRNDAMRALLIIAKYASSQSELKIVVPTLPFVRMLNSLVWTDRNKSSGAIDILSVNRDPALLTELRRQAVDSLVEMANWTNPSHAEASFKILGRVAGLSESEISELWKSTEPRGVKVQKMVKLIRISK